MVVASAGALPADVSEAVVNEVRHEGVDDAVVTLATVFTRRHQLEMAKKSELVAHRGHRQPQGVGEIADAKLIVGECVHQAQPQRVRKGEEHLDGLGGRLRSR